MEDNLETELRNLSLKALKSNRWKPVGEPKILFANSHEAIVREAPKNARRYSIGKTMTVTFPPTFEFGPESYEHYVPIQYYQRR